jgi:CHAT domain-containing protein
MMALDFRANRATATSSELGQYRIVHFATHGLLNSEHPELSGLVLSLVDEQGRPVDGFLRLHEVYNLRLPVELVVLSACQTGLGREVKGEGLVGLTRGFMYAGAARVAASLWKVDDAATMELMGRFYRGMLKEGLRPAAALRAAQLEMWRTKRWREPYYWAAFVLQGEWR